MGGPPPMGGPTPSGMQPMQSRPPGPHGFPASSPQSPTGPGEYQYVEFHWYYCKHVELRTMWFPFSLLDSMRLEEAENTGKKKTSSRCFKKISGLKIIACFSDMKLR